MSQDDKSNCIQTYLIQDPQIQHFKYKYVILYLLLFCELRFVISYFSVQHFGLEVLKCFINKVGLDFLIHPKSQTKQPLPFF